jgi:hypothetical protein
VAAASYGIRRLPAVVIDGRLADWHAGRGLDEVTLTREIFAGTARFRRSRTRSNRRPSGAQSEH